MPITILRVEYPVDVLAARPAHIRRIWVALTFIGIQTTSAQIGGSARVLVNPPVSLNVMLE